MADPIEILFSFLGGVFTGWLIQYVVFKNALKIEKIKRLSPRLELGYPIVEKLSLDATYVRGINVNDDQTHFTAILDRIKKGLNTYQEWYNGFREEGMFPELESVNSYLLGLLNGLFQYSNLCKLHGTQYISENCQSFDQHCRETKEMLKDQLTS